MSVDSPLGEAPLRVHHFVDGRRVLEPSESVHVLDLQATDLGRRGVPIASGAEVADYLARSCDGLARWLALGADARRDVLLTVHRHYSGATLAIAEALADDFGESCEAAVRIAEFALATMTEVLESPSEPGLTLGLHVVATTERLAGVHFVRFIWPLLLHGSTVVVHPSPKAPRTTTLLAELASRAGLPDGVLNVIHGDRVTLRALLGSPLVAGVVGIGPADHNHDVSTTAVALGKLGVAVDVPT